MAGGDAAEESIFRVEHVVDLVGLIYLRVGGRSDKGVPRGIETVANVEGVGKRGGREKRRDGRFQADMERIVGDDVIGCQSVASVELGCASSRIHRLTVLVGALGAHNVAEHARAGLFGVYSTCYLRAAASVQQFDVCEEEGLVFPDRPTDGATVHILDELRTRKLRCSSFGCGKSARRNGDW